MLLPLVYTKNYMVITLYLNNYVMYCNVLSKLLIFMSLDIKIAKKFWGLCPLKHHEDAVLRPYMAPLTPRQIFSGFQQMSLEALNKEKVCCG